MSTTKRCAIAVLITLCATSPTAFALDPCGREACVGLCFINLFFDVDACLDCIVDQDLDACLDCGLSTTVDSDFCRDCASDPIANWPDCVDCAFSVLLDESCWECVEPEDSDLQAITCTICVLKSTRILFGLFGCALECAVENPCDITVNFLACYPDEDFGYYCQNSIGYHQYCDADGTEILEDLVANCRSGDQACEYDTGNCVPCEDDRDNRTCVPYESCRADLKQDVACTDPRDPPGYCDIDDDPCTCSMALYDDSIIDNDGCIDDADGDGTPNQYTNECVNDTHRLVNTCSASGVCEVELQACPNGSLCRLTGVCCTDQDSDGFTACDDPPDCGPNDPLIFPFAYEFCDGKDNDCDNQTDEGSRAPCLGWLPGVRLCEQGSITCSGGQEVCQLNAFTTLNPPEQNEVFCDNVDNDCDGEVDEDYPVFELCDCPCNLDPIGLYMCIDPPPANCDLDNTENCVECACPEPDLDEICNQEDDDCDGAIDNVADPTLCQCSGGGLPEPERCDGIDNDCDDDIDEDESGGLLTLLCDEHGQCICKCQSGSWVCGVADGPVVPETGSDCDGIDNDCDGVVDGSAGSLALVSTFADGSSSKDLTFDGATDGPCIGFGVPICPPESRTVNVEVPAQSEVLFARMNLTGMEHTVGRDGIFAFGTNDACWAGSAAGVTAYSQSFIAGVDNLTAIKLAVELSCSSPCPPDNTFRVSVDLWDDNAGQPGTIITSNSALVTSPPGVLVVAEVPLSASLEVGETYHVSVFSPQFAVPANQQYPLCVWGQSFCFPQPPFITCNDFGDTHRLETPGWILIGGFRDLSLIQVGTWTDHATDLTLDAGNDGTVNWDHLGEFHEVRKTFDFADDLNTVLQECIANQTDPCTLPIKITAHTFAPGIVRLDELAVGIGERLSLQRQCIPDCGGVETCVDGVWACDIVPEMEICDGLDNECDGTIDNVSGGNSIQESKCQCYDGGTPDAQETCDFIDNTCDGVIDEGCTCEQLCTAAGYAISECRNSGQLGGGCFDYEDDVGQADSDCSSSIPAIGKHCCCTDVALCHDDDLDGYYGGDDPAADCPQITQVDCNDTDHLIYPGAPERCNNEDDDCDTDVDENVTRSCGKGACAGGSQSCTAGDWGECSTLGQATEEQCDNIDNNCNGLIDELTRECVSAGQGVCSQGWQSCNGGAWGTCNAPVPVAETCNGADNDCDGVIDNGFLAAPALADPSGIDKARYISLVPGNPGMQTALRVELVACAGFPSFNGQVRWVRWDDAYPEENSAVPGLTFRGALLACGPAYKDWGTISLLHVFSGDLVPQSTYEVRSVALGCNENDLARYSAPLLIETGKWGDLTSLFDGDNPAIPQPDFNDVAASVDKFLADPAAPIKALAQQQPDTPNPAGPIDFRDIADVVSAFVGSLYPYHGPCACPSTVTCEATTCTLDSECAGGLCRGGFCVDPCGRCTP